MKIRELIQEFIPCEICGNSDIKNFYFHVLVDKGSQPYVKCCECEEEYYSESARNVLIRVEESKRAKIASKITFKQTLEGGFRNQESIHPLVKILSQM